MSPFNADPRPLLVAAVQARVDEAVEFEWNRLRRRLATLDAADQAVVHRHLAAAAAAAVEPVTRVRDRRLAALLLAALSTPTTATRARLEGVAG